MIHPTVNLYRLLHKQLITLPRKNIKGHHFKTAIKSGIKTIKASYFAISHDMGPYNQPKNKGEFFDHHLCHIASAYFPSNFDKALIFSLDGMGDHYSCRVYLGDDGKLTQLKSYYYEEMPVGLNYELITAMLGFNPVRHAGKITGLAAYGTHKPQLKKDLDQFFEETWNRKVGKGKPNYDDYQRDYSKLDYLLSLPKTRFKEYSREDIAYYIQERSENEVRKLIRPFMKQYPEIKNVALSGGVFANVKINQRVKEMGFDNLFVQPAMSDAGLSFGAALLRLYKQKGRLKPFRLKHVFLGYKLTQKEIEREIKNFSLHAEYFEEEKLFERVAELIIDKKVVAHCNGAMEYGPRALGNRTIMYSAQEPEVNNWLNKQLNRTEFMPFAPAVLAEEADSYFLNLDGVRHTAEFMTITADCTERAQMEIPAAVHVDNTARPQIVTNSANARFYGILSAYHRKTGIAAMINTSFNMHEEPIVATAADAIRSFQQGHLDVLVLGNYIIEASKQK